MKKLFPCTIWLSIGGQYGGFYVQWKKYTKRICLGYIALTYLPVADEVLAKAINRSVE